MITKKISILHQPTYVRQASLTMALEVDYHTFFFLYRLRSPQRGVCAVCVENKKDVVLDTFGQFISFYPLNFNVVRAFMLIKKAAKFLFGDIITCV